MIRLEFHAGTLEVKGLPRQISPNPLPPACVWDPRSACFRAPAQAYEAVVMALLRAGLDCDDAARDYDELPGGLRVHREPRPFQTEALEAWIGNRGRGVIVLPTGAGKSHVAVLGIDHWRRSTLVVAPTLDLVHQWYALLASSFPEVPVGVVGGGEHRIEPITVTTYDSAHLHMHHLGARFGLIVFDECHHLPGDVYALAARASLAPFRLGLSATPERADGRHLDLDTLIGPRVYERAIVELAGEWLADYEVQLVTVELSPEEQAEYTEARGIYRDFVQRQGIRMSQPGGWQAFVQRSSRTEEGRRAMDAYGRQRRLAFTARSKLDYLEHLLSVHRADRALVFTQDNRTAHTISRRFLIPVITHQTKVSERAEILAGLAEGAYTAVVASKVLNEGVDVPAASVAIVVSGSGSKREHVQRLGRVLRPQPGKRAILYELVAGDTSETFTSQRRREHVAYR